MEEMIRSYISQLTEQELLVLEIARDHLGSSFDISKSIGFLNWIEKQDKPK